jgi:hypothetical protein
MTGAISLYVGGVIALNKRTSLTIKTRLTNVILKAFSLQNQLYFNSELESGDQFGIPWQHNNALKTDSLSPYNHSTHYRLFPNVVHSFY